MVELIWDGKYDAQGRRVAPLRLKLPFQTVETVNESTETRQRSLFGPARHSEWRNRLIWGDKKYVLPALLDEFAGKVDLIYIDPPFATGADFSFQVEVEGEEFTKEASIIEQKAYRDTWGRGDDSYLQWFNETIILLHELLTYKGSLYVHLDWHMVHYAQVVLDEVFGRGNFVNQIVWHYYNKFQGNINHFPANHDLILWYRKGEKFVFIPQYEKRDKPVKQLKRAWDKEKEAIVNVKDEAGKVIYQESTTRRVDDVWRLSMLQPADKTENLGYPTQKPEALLERIINASSNENDLILDCFAGSGTTAAVAEKLGRRWITCDLGRFAVHTTRKRLLGIPNVRPFVVQNLGKYERQAWQAAEFGNAERAAEINGRYRRFILDLYGARPIEGYNWLHGLKGGRMVHVGPVDSPISPADVTQIAIEFRKAIGRGQDAPALAAVDVLGWDFAFELNEVARQQAEAANLNVRFVRIPREVLEQKAVDQGDIRFFELAALAVDVHVETGRRPVSTDDAHNHVETGLRPVSTKGGDNQMETGRRPVSTADVTLKLTDFVIPPDDVPDDVQRAISHWAQWIDYWAVDWDNRGDTFHNMWQTYRTRGKKKGGEALQLQTTHRYEQPGDYTIMVKVIDILGNDTTKTVKVTVL